MKFLSADADFNSKSLDGLSGSLSKVTYMAALRGEDGELSHWGLERSYGPEQAHETLKKAYAEQVHELLRTSIRDLWHDAGQVREDGTKLVEVSLPQLRDSVQSIKNERLHVPQTLHLKSVLDALSELAMRQQTSPGS